MKKPARASSLCLALGLAGHFLATAKGQPPFDGAITAIGRIELSTNNLKTDSFDSADPLHSDNGQYPYLLAYRSRALDNGDVRTLGSFSNTIGNLVINGKVKTGPLGTIAIGPNGSVGSKAWVEGGNKGIQPGYSTEDFNFSFPNAVLPSVPAWSAIPSLPYPPPVINGVTYDLILTSGNYIANALPKKIYVAPGQQVIVRVTGSVSLSGPDRIDISTNASLVVCMGSTTGTSVSFSISGGPGSINNLSKNALGFVLCGLPTCTSISLGSFADFSGIIYAPQADLSLGDGGATTHDFIGASVTKTVTMNGNFIFHYDENLKRAGPTYLLEANPPPITISRSAEGIRIAWSVYYTPRFVLQEMIAPSGTWINSPANVVVQGYEYVAIISTTNTGMFYRLRK